MKGGIYCGECEKRIDEKRGHCPEHPGAKFRVKFGKTRLRCKSYAWAARTLNGLRFKQDEGIYDPRDYQKDAPIGFIAQSEKYLMVKKETLTAKTYSNLCRSIGKAQAVWGHQNVKEIGYPELEELIFAQPGSDKTRANFRNDLHAFWNWLRKRKVIEWGLMPEFPEVTYKLGYREIIDKETQQAIIEEVHRLSYNVNPKIWVGIRWLATYISVRPIELLRVREKHVNRSAARLLIPDPKNADFRIVPLLEEDVAVLEEIPQGLPELPFFRHPPRYSSREGEPFGEKYFYKWWKRACESLGIHGVDLYGGTRHSSATALREHFSFEEVRELTGHNTNAAFERYFQKNLAALRKGYAKTRIQGGTDKYEDEQKWDQPGTNETDSAKRQVVELKRKVWRRE